MPNGKWYLKLTSITISCVWPWITQVNLLFACTCASNRKTCTQRGLKNYAMKKYMRAFQMQWSWLMTHRLESKACSTESYNECIMRDDLTHNPKSRASNTESCDEHIKCGYLT